MPKAWRTSRRENLNLVVQAKTPEELARPRRRNGPPSSSGGRSAARPTWPSSRARASTTPRTRSRPIPKGGSRRSNEATTSAAAKTRASSRGPRAATSQQGRPEARREVARRRAQGQGREGQGRARRGDRGRAVREEEADGEPQKKGELGRKSNVARASRAFEPSPAGSLLSSLLSCF